MILGRYALVGTSRADQPEALTAGLARVRARAQVSVALRLRHMMDVKLVLTATNNTADRARILAAHLMRSELAGVPIGVGVQEDGSACTLTGWAEGVQLADYPGPVHHDGVDELIRIVRQSPSPVYLLALAPFTNVAAAFAAAPDIVPKLRVFAMGGGLHFGYNHTQPAAPEYNIYANVSAARALFGQAGLPVTLAPLDTAGVAQLTGTAYQRFWRAATVERQPAAATLLSAYEYWAPRCPWANEGPWPVDPARVSSVLYDPVAAMLLVHALEGASPAVDLERMNVCVAANGLTTPCEQPHAAAVQAALRWRSLGAFEEFVASALVSA